MNYDTEFPGIQIPRPTHEYIVVRADYMLPFSTEDVEARIQDGYVLTKGKLIIEAGKYTVEIGKRIVSSFSPLLIIGLTSSSTKKRVFEDDPIPRMRAILTPGFVKAHGHDHESPIVGLNKEAQLVEWLDKCVNPFTGLINEKTEQLTKELGESPHLVTYRKARLDDLMFGITSVQTHHCNHNKYHVPEIVQANLEAGTRMIVAVGSQDRFYDPRILDTPEGAVARLDGLHARFKDAERTTIVPGPDQLFSNGPELLKALKKWAREHSTLFHIHSSEEPGTTKWFIETNGQTPVEYAADIGILDSDSVFAHQVNCTEHDLDLLAEHDVKIAHNPLANTILSSGMPPIPKMRARGIEIAIATDGSGSADSQNILSAVRACCQYFRASEKAPQMRAMEALAMACAVPARYLHFNAGRLQAGYSADLVLIDTTVPNMIPTHLETCAENLIWAASGSEVTHVVASGVLLVNDRAYTASIGFDPARTLEQVQRLSEIFVESRASMKEIKATGERTADL